MRTERARNDLANGILGRRLGTSADSHFAAAGEGLAAPRDRRARHRSWARGPRHSWGTPPCTRHVLEAPRLATPGSALWSLLTRASSPDPHRSSPLPHGALTRGRAKATTRGSSRRPAAASSDKCDGCACGTHPALNRTPIELQCTGTTSTVTDTTSATWEALPNMVLALQLAAGR